MSKLLKRFVVWLCETLFSAVLGSLFFMTVGPLMASGHRDHPMREFAFLLVGALTFLVIESGYFLTTGIFGVLLRNRLFRYYPAIAGALFIFHWRLRFSGDNEPFFLVIQVGGAIIVFACAYAGGKCLERWK